MLPSAKLLKQRPDPSPTSSPTTSPISPPATPLLKFLTEESFDMGAALKTSNSAQQKAWIWLELSTLYNSVTNYTLLQFYALAVFNYATDNTLSNNTWLQDNGTDSEYNFCVWNCIDCNSGTDITALNTTNSALVGSLPDRTLDKSNFSKIVLQ